MLAGQPQEAMRGGALSFSYLKSLLETGELRRMIGSLKSQSLSDEKPPQVGHAEETRGAALLHAKDMSPDEVHGLHRQQAAWAHLSLPLEEVQQWIKENSEGETETPMNLDDASTEDSGTNQTDGSEDTSLFSGSLFSGGFSRESSTIFSHEHSPICTLAELASAASELEASRPDEEAALINQRRRRAEELVQELEERAVHWMQQVGAIKMSSHQLRRSELKKHLDTDRLEIVEKMLQASYEGLMRSIRSDLHSASVAHPRFDLPKENTDKNAPIHGENALLDEFVMSPSATAGAQLANPLLVSPIGRVTRVSPVLAQKMPGMSATHFGTCSSANFGPHGHLNQQFPQDAGGLKDSQMLPRPFTSDSMLSSDPNQPPVAGFTAAGMMAHSHMASCMAPSIGMMAPSRMLAQDGFATSNPIHPVAHSGFNPLQRPIRHGSDAVAAMQAPPLQQAHQKGRRRIHRPPETSATAGTHPTAVSPGEAVSQQGIAGTSVAPGARPRNASTTSTDATTGKKRRQNHTPEQIHILTNWFKTHEFDPYPGGKEKERLSQVTGLDVRQIEHWFTNRRKRSWRTKSLKALRDEHRLEYERMVLLILHTQSNPDEKALILNRTLGFRAARCAYSRVPLDYQDAMALDV